MSYISPIYSGVSGVGVTTSFEGGWDTRDNFSGGLSFIDPSDGLNQANRSTASLIDNLLNPNASTDASAGSPISSTLGVLLGGAIDENGLDQDGTSRDSGFGGALSFPGPNPSSSGRAYREMLGAVGSSDPLDFFVRPAYGSYGTNEDSQPRYAGRLPALNDASNLVGLVGSGFEAYQAGTEFIANGQNLANHNRLNPGTVFNLFKDLEAYRRYLKGFAYIQGALDATNVIASYAFADEATQQEMHDDHYLAIGLGRAAVNVGAGIAGGILGTALGTAMVAPVMGGLALLGPVGWVVAGAIVGVTAIAVSAGVAGAVVDVYDRIMGTFFGSPVVLDLDGDGIELTDLTQSSIFVDLDGDGALERSGWVGADDGILVLDTGPNGPDGQITSILEYVFTEHSVDARTDLEALAEIFDTNQDGVLDASDAQWSSFRVWQDVNQNGISDAGEIIDLAAIGLTSIDLQSDGNAELRDLNILHGISSAETTAGTIAVGDVSFGAFEEDYSLVETIAEGRVIADSEGRKAAILHENVISADAGLLGVSGLYGGTLSNVLSSGASVEVELYGGAGNDTLIGGTGSDFLNGGSGSDVLSAGGGDDVLIVDADDISVFGGDGFDVLFGVGQFGLSLDIGGAEIEMAQGTAQSDALTTSVDNDVTLFGAAGDDVLTGAGGNDQLEGGSGADTLTGGFGADRLLGDEGDDSLFGGADNDFLEAGEGSDTLDGGAGDDVLVSRLGSNTLYGGDGVDHALFDGAYTDFDITLGGAGQPTFVRKIDPRTGEYSQEHTVYSTERLIFADRVVHVSEDNQSVQASDDRLYGRNTGSGVILASTILRNDIDPDRDRLEIESLQTGPGISAWVDDFGNIAYEIDPLFVGEKEISYIVSDGQGSTDEGAVTLTILQGAPEDDLFDEAWHLDAIRVQRVWDDYTGAGVDISINDDGFQSDHWDIDDNYDTSRDYDPLGNDSDPFFQGDEFHGTGMAGIIASERNDQGSVGVAYNSTLIGFRGTAFWETQHFDISSNSWGLPDNELNVGGYQNALYYSDVINATQNGRGGLGTAIVTSAGNDRLIGGNANMTAFHSMRQSIVVGAAMTTGRIAPFSSAGANLLVSAPGVAILAADNTGSDGQADDESAFGSDFQDMDGTSAAAPIVSGVIALMLEANDGLGYRDVQEILAYSAQQVDSTSDDWQINGASTYNGGGFHVGHDHGFGFVDAFAAVRLAETWQSVKTASNEATLSAASVGSFAFSDDASTSSTVSVTNTIGIQYVEVDLNISHAERRDLVVTLTSPDGTKSVLLENPYGMAGNPDPGTQANVNTTFTSKNHWGESGTGEWTLTVTDSAGNALGGTVNNWNLRFYGDADSNDDTYVYTNEFTRLATLDAARQTLSDSNGGIDRINASAMSDHSYIDLSGNSESLLGAVELVIDENTTIENAWTGDGNDLLTGNSVGNTLVSGRGDDVLVASGGDDVLDGGEGNDVVDYSAESDAISVNLASGTAVKAGSATDVLSGIENVVGGTGADILTGDGQDNALTGGAGDDILEGASGDDALMGDSGNDTLRGGEGDDTLFAGEGDDTLEGGSGLDTAMFRGVSADYSWSTNGGITTVTGLDGTDTAVDVEFLRFSDTTVYIGANQSPIGVSDSATVQEDGSVTLTASSLLLNDTDADSSTLSLVSVGDSQNGRVLLTDSGDIIFTPDENFEGAASFAYVVSDETGLTSTVNVDVDVQGTNDAPEAVSGKLLIGKGSTGSGSLQSNEIDAGDTLTYSLSVGGDPAHGTVSIASDGTYQYTADPDFVGIDRFKFSVTDASGLVSEETIVVEAGSHSIASTAETFVQGDFDWGETSPSLAKLGDQGDTVLSYSGWDEETWSWAVMGREISSDGQTQGAEFIISTDEVAAAATIKSATMDDGRIVSVWQKGDGPGTASGAGLWGRFLNTDGTQSAAFQIATDSGFYSEEFDLTALSDGGFAVAYASGDYASSTITGRRFDNSGAQVGNAVTISDDGNRAHGKPAIEETADGGYFVAWQARELGRDGNETDRLYGRQVDNSGAAGQQKLLVNLDYYGWPGNADLALLEDGTLALVFEQGGTYAYEDPTQGTYGDVEIFAQKISTDGEVIGEKSQVNVGRTDYQTDPTVTALLDGGFVVTWESMAFEESYSGNSDESADGDGRGLFARRFSREGYAVSGDTQINHQGMLDQWSAAVVANEDGGFSVAWVNETPLAETSDLAVRRYTADYDGDLKLIGSDGADVIYGKDGDDVLMGFQERDTLIGGDGEDLLAGGAGDDVIFGGFGDDSARYAGLRSGYQVDVQGAQAVVTDIDMSDGDEGSDTLTSIESLIFSDQTISVDAVNQIAQEDTISGAVEDVAFTITAAELLSNDTPNGTQSPLQLVDVGSAEYGSVSLDQNSDIVFTADPNFSGEATFQYRVQAADGTFEDTTVTVNVDAVADTPSLTVRDISGKIPARVSLDITTSSQDTDGSETVSVTISGVPDGAVLSSGDDLGNGVWRLTDSQLDGLAIELPLEYAGQASLSVTATTTETATGATQSVTDTLVVERIATEQFEAFEEVFESTNLTSTAHVVNDATPRITALSDGRFVGVWQQYGGSDAEGGIFYQFFDKYGAVEGAVQKIEGTLPLWDTFPEVAATADGGYAVVWQNWYGDGDQYSIQIATFDENGSSRVHKTPVVNDSGLGYQTDAKVVSMANGQLFVMWEDGGVDGAGPHALKGRMVDLLGFPKSDEFTITSGATAGYSADVVAQSDGVSISWVAEDSDGSRSISYAAVRSDGSIDYTLPVVSEFDTETLQNLNNGFGYSGHSGSNLVESDTILLANDDGSTDLFLVSQFSFGDGDNEYVNILQGSIDQNGILGSFEPINEVQSGQNVFGLGAHKLENGEVILNTGYLHRFQSNFEHIGRVGKVTHVGTSLERDAFAVNNDGVVVTLTMTRPPWITFGDYTYNPDIETHTYRITGGLVSHGTDGDDSIVGSYETEYLASGDGDDRILTSSGNDEVYAGNGNDTITIGDGNKLIFGGEGHDTLILRDSTLQDPNNTLTISADLEAGTLQIGEWSTGISSIESVVSGSYQTGTILGSSEDNSLHGKAWLDLIDGRDGDDILSGAKTLIGGAGNDTLTASIWTGTSTLSGGAGSDTIIGNSLNAADGVLYKDVAVFDGDASQYSISAVSEGQIQVTDLSSPGDVDTLFNIGELHFNDSYINPAFSNVRQDIAITISNVGANSLSATDFLSADSNIFGQTAELTFSTVSGLTDTGSGWTLDYDILENSSVSELAFDVSFDGISARTFFAGIHYNYINDAPIVSAPVNLSGLEDDVLIITSSELLANASDANGHSLSVTGLTASSGTLTYQGDDSWTLDAGKDANGNVSLSYFVSDGIDDVATSAVASFSPVNDAPEIIGTETFSSPADTPLTITATELMANAVDVDGDSLTLTGLTSSSGTLTSMGSDTWVLDPGANIDVDIDLNFNVSDGVETVGVSASVMFQNEAPVVSDELAFTILADNVLTVTAAELLANASDLDGDSLSVVNLLSNSGTLTEISTGTWTFTPDHDFVGDVELTYDVSDGGYSDNATATVSVSRHIPFSASEQVRVNQYTPNAQQGSIVTALTGGNYVVTWSSYNQDGSANGAYARVYDSNGVAIGSEFQVSTHTNHNQHVTSVVATEDGFVTFLSSRHDSDAQDDVYARRFNNSGTPETNDVLVNTTTLGSQTLADAAVASDGSMFVAWQSSSGDLSWKGVFGQLLDPNGVPMGSQIQINTTTLDDQERPSVAALAGGGYVVVWQSEDQDPDSSDGLYGQILDANGQLVGGEFSVPANPDGVERWQQVLALANGNFLVAWDDYDVGGNVYRVFDGDGVSIGSEKTLPTTWDDYDLVASPDGGFVALGSRSQSARRDIVAVHYDGLGNVLIPAYEVAYDPSWPIGDPSGAILSNGNLVVSWTASDGESHGIIKRTFDVDTWNDTAPIVSGSVDLEGTEDQVLTITAAELLSKSSDFDGDSLIVTGLTAAEGTLTELGSDTWTLEMGANFHGDVALSYSVTDGTVAVATSATAAFDAVNDIPFVTGPLEILGIEDSVLTITTVDLLENVSDADGDNLSVSELSTQSGVLTDIGGGTWTLDAGANFNGDIDLTYNVDDGEESFAALATVSFAAVNDAPTFTGPVTLSALEDTALTITSSELLTNISDIDGDSLAISNLSASSGTITGSGDGTWILEADDNFYGEIELNYSVSDGMEYVTGELAVADFAPVNDIPISSGDVMLSAVEDTVLTITAAELLSNSSDIEGTSLIVPGAVLASSGTITDLGNGTWTLDAGANFNGEVGLFYGVSDGTNSLFGTLAIADFASVNDTPIVSAPVNLNGAEDQVLTITAAELLGSSSDVDGDSLSVANLSATSGTLTDLCGGTWTLDAGADVNGDVGLTYNVTDGTDSVAATAVVNFAAVNDAPTDVAIQNPTVSEHALTGASLGTVSVSDPDTNDSHTFALIDNANGRFAIDSVTGEITLAGSLDYESSSTHNIMIRVTDSAGLTSDWIRTVSVSNENDVPVLVDDTGQVIAGLPLTIPGVDLLANDSDADGDQLSITAVSSSIVGGSLVFDAIAQSIVFTPNPGYVGQTSFTYTVSDGAGGMSNATATLIVSVTDVFLHGTSGADSLHGGDGNDGLYGGAGDDTLNGGLGNDYVEGGDGLDAIQGGGGDDGLYGHAGSDVIAGGAGNDYIDGGTEGDTLTGGDGNDGLYGREGSDSLYGEAGDDYLAGGLGDDVLDGGSGTDNLTGEDGADQLYGRDGNDILVGGNGNDYAEGGAGDDQLFGDAGDDQLSGGDGNDTIAGGDGIDGLHGNSGNDYIDAGLGNDYVTGGVGDDTLLGGDGVDGLYGGDNNDTLLGQLGNDYIEGGTGADTIEGGAGDDGLHGQDGSDTIRGDGGADYISGGGDDDFVYGGDDNDQINGDAGNDWLYGENGNDIVVGGDGNDRVEGGAGDDQLYGDAGDDIVVGGIGDDTLYGFTGADELHGGDGADTIGGDDGDDLIFGGAGGDVIAGGAGSDTASYDSSDTGISADLTAQAYSGGHAEGDQLSGIENLSGSSHADFLKGDANTNVLSGADGDDELRGMGGDDTLSGGDGNDLLNGGSGDDVLFGGAGADSLFGWTGSDTASYSGSDAGIAVNLNAGTSSGGHATGDTLTDIENIVGSAYQDDVTGDSENNTLTGLDGNDTLSGLSGDDVLHGDAGDDTLLGGSGLDTLFGGDGNDDLRGWVGDDNLIGGDGDDMLSGQDGGDTLIGGAGHDTAVYDLSDVAVNVDLTAGTASGGSAAGDSLSEIESLIGSDHDDFLKGDAVENTLTGGDGSDELRGMAGNDELDGGAGADLINGGAGDDLIIGGAGGDSIYGWTGIDTVEYSASTQGVDVNLTAGSASGGHAAGDLLTDIENLTGSAYADILKGDGNANTLVGGDGSDELRGMAGNDVLDGGAGADLMNGGAGDDLIVGGAGGDSIYGWTGNDTVDYSGSSLAVDVDFTAGTASGGYAANDQLTDIENLIGSIHDDVLKGDGNVNVFAGGAGADELRGMAGDDALSGEGGDDLLYGGTGNDVVNGGDGNDVVNGWDGDDTLIGGTGNDTLDGGLGNDRFEFQSGDGQDVIDDADHDASSTDTLAFGGALSRDDLWFAQSGNDLQIDLLGSNDRVTLSGWFGSGTTSDERMDRVEAGGDVLTEANVQQLVNAMASWSAANSGSDGDNLAEMPDDQTLSGVIATAWQTIT